MRYYVGREKTYSSVGILYESYSGEFGLIEVARGHVGDIQDLARRLNDALDKAGGEEVH